MKKKYEHVRMLIPFDCLNPIHIYDTLETVERWDLGSEMKMEMWVVGA